MVSDLNDDQPSSSTINPAPRRPRPDVQVFDDRSKAELLAHVQLLLSSYGFHRTANELVEEIQENGMVPVRYDINGQTHQQTFSEYMHNNAGCSTDFVEMLKRLNELQCEAVPPVVPNLPIRLFASKRHSLARRSDVLTRAPRLEEATCSRPSLWSLEQINTPSLLMARQLGGQMPHPRRLMLRKESMADLQLHKRIFGHLGPIFCVKFDATGRYIFTGADDNLIKVWDAYTCLLRYTFRGHIGYIMDMAVSPDNTVLASGSMDKTVRMWCLQRGKLLHINKGHTASITTIGFLPYMKGNTRYLVSAGSDCSVFFFRYEAPNQFRGTTPIVFNERSKSGVKLVSLCYSPGGTLVALGDTHQCIRLYQVSENNVERLFQVPAHSDRVDSLIWAHKSLRFVSGSKDGTAKAWYIGDKGWCSTTLKMPKALTGAKTNSPPRVVPYQRMMPDGMGGYVMQTVINHGAHNQLRTKKNSYRVTMLCWAHDDDVIVSSGSDNMLRTWNWRTGDQLRVLNGHSDEAFVLLAHPVYREYVLSVGHDAKLIVWNVYTGQAVKIHHNDGDNEANEKRAIFDMCISPNGTMVGFVDNYGNLSVLGVSSNETAGRVPREQFLHTDYRSFVMDGEGYVIDEATGLAPHNMDSPIFVSSDGAPHADEWQRRIPGRDLMQADIEPICPWVNRKIVPTLTDTERERMLSEWEVVHEAELHAIDNLPNAVKINEINPEHRQLVVRQRRPPGATVNASAAHIAHLEQLRSRLMNPEYVIDGEDDSDNDPSYTAGDDNSHRSAGSQGVEEDEPEDDVDSEYEDQPPMAPYSSAMRLRGGARRLPHLRRLRGGLDDGDDSHGHSSDTQPVRRSRRHLPAGYVSTSPGNSPPSEAPPPSPPQPAPTTRQTRNSRRTAARNVRENSRSSKENASVSNEDEPCCSRTLAAANAESSISAEADGEAPSTSSAATSSAAAVEATTAAARDDSSAGEECHESDNTYKNDSPSSHADEEEEEEEEGVEEEEEIQPPSRSQRNYHSAYSPPVDEPLLSTPTESSASSPSSSSCYSSGKKTRRPPLRGRRRANDEPSSSRANATPRAVVKRKAKRCSETSDREEKRPRRAAANNALNRFRQSSEFEDANDEETDEYGHGGRATRRTAAARSVRDSSGSPVRRRRNARRIRVSSNDDDDNDGRTEEADTIFEPSTSSGRSRRYQPPKVHFPPRTRTGRRVIPTVRYAEDD